MRAAVPVCVLLFVAGCATSLMPRQYLDEETAATITVVAKPWIFALEAPGAGVMPRGFLNLYAFDVNRTGTHQQYLAVMQSSFDVALPDEKTSTTKLDIQAGDRTLTFQSSTQTPRQLGVARPLDQPLALQSRWLYFPATRQEIATVTQLPTPRIKLVANDSQFNFVEFRNGSRELTEFAATLR